MVGEFVKGLVGVVVNFLEYLCFSEVDFVDEIVFGEGVIVWDGLFVKLVVYCIYDGDLIELFVMCIYVGCIVYWNFYEKCWDCFCYGF